MDHANEVRPWRDLMTKLVVPRMSMRVTRRIEPSVTSPSRAFSDPAPNPSFEGFSYHTKYLPSRRGLKLRHSGIPQNSQTGFTRLLCFPWIRHLGITLCNSTGTALALPKTMPNPSWSQILADSTAGINNGMTTKLELHTKNW